MINVSELTRDGKVLLDALVVNKDDSVTVTEDCLVYVPKRFLEGSLGSMSSSSSTINVSCVLGVVFPNRKTYSPITSVMRVNTTPFSIDEQAINGVEYYVLEYNKGDTIFDSLYCIQDTQLSYAYYMELNYYAKLPWYLDQDDLSSIFDNAKSEAGNQVGSDPHIVRVINGVMFRDPDNLDRPYGSSTAIDKGIPPTIVGLNNSAMLADGTFSKLMGGYLQDNIVANIVNPDTRVTDLEQLIKGVPTQ